MTSNWPKLCTTLFLADVVSVLWCLICFRSVFIDLKTDTGSSETACGAVCCDSTKVIINVFNRTYVKLVLKIYVIRKDCCLFAALYRRWSLVNLSETNPSNSEFG